MSTYLFQLAQIGADLIEVFALLNTFGNYVLCLLAQLLSIENRLFNITLLLGCHYSNVRLCTYKKAPKMSQGPVLVLTCPLVCTALGPP
jgi:hypothetical protein